MDQDKRRKELEEIERQEASPSRQKALDKYELRGVHRLCSLVNTMAKRLARVPRNRHIVDVSGSVETGERKVEEGK